MKKNPYIHTDIKIQMNKWLNDTDMFYIQNSKKKMLFVTVKWQVINAEGILELDKLFVCKNHSNNDFRHISILFTCVYVWEYVYGLITEFWFMTKCQLQIFLYCI